MTAVVFDCSFQNPKTGERRCVTVALTDHDLAAVAHIRLMDGDAQADLHAQAHALHHAYKKVPRGFGHDARPVRRWMQ